MITKKTLRPTSATSCYRDPQKGIDTTAVAAAVRARKSLSSREVEQQSKSSGTMPAMDRLQDFFVFTLSPSLAAIVTLFLVALTLPLLLHSYIYRTRAAINLPAFLLVGPSGAGKTSLLTLVGLYTRRIPLHKTNA